MENQNYRDEMTGSMTFDEWKKIAKMLRSVYTSQNFLPDADSIKLWYLMLNDLPYKYIQISVQKHIATNKFPPTIAEIRGGAVEITSPESDWAASWRRVLRAISKYGFYRQQEALDSFDDLTRRCVQRLGWKELCMSENIMTDRANYRMIYEQLQNKTADQAKLPPAVKKGIEQLQQQTKALEEARCRE